MGVASVDTPRLLDMLKAQKAGGDLLTLQEILNEQQKGFYTH
jgi:ribosomal protein L18E